MLFLRFLKTFAKIFFSLFAKKIILPYKWLTDFLYCNIINHGIVLKVQCNNQSEVRIMKPNIHPEYKPVKVQCACGETFITGSTKKGDLIKVDICSKCHPFFTGKQKLVDTGGRVDKFKKRYGM